MKTKIIILILSDSARLLCARKNDTSEPFLPPTVEYDGATGFSAGEPLPPAAKAVAVDALLQDFGIHTIASSVVTLGDYGYLAAVLVREGLNAGMPRNGEVLGGKMSVMWLPLNAVVDAEVDDSAATARTAHPVQQALRNLFPDGVAHLRPTAWVGHRDTKVTP